jgi:RnfABCDGE-type electron transport complex B subunit
VAEKFKVEEDPRIDDVEKALPGANCGGCGQAGCRAFAQFCVESEDLDKCFCPVGGNDVMQKVASVLGRAVAAKDPMVAVVRCNGTCENRPRIAQFDGAASCRVQQMTGMGETACGYGCLGCGDCVAACQFGAISIDPATGIPAVDEEKCTSCGACVKACPRNIIELRKKGPKGRRVYVSCVNKDKGPVAMKACAVSCIGCGKCEKECNFGAITVENNLAYIDFEKCRLCRKCVTACPKKAILDVNFPTPAPAPKPKEPAAPKPAPEEKPSESPKAAPAEKPKEAPKPVEKPKAPVEQKPAVKEPSRGAFLDTDSSISIK